MHICHGSYQPIESKAHCEMFYCYAGLGLAGMGYCFANGAWWMQCCPEFMDDKEFEIAMGRDYFEWWVTTA